MSARLTTTRPTPAFQPSVVVVTGGAGFIGSNLVRRLLATEPTLRVITVDALTYAGNLESLADVLAAHGDGGDGRHYFVHADIRDQAAMEAVLMGTATAAGSGRTVPMPDAVLHLAAESHVDRSILGPATFVATNVQGTLSLLEATRRSLTLAPRPFRFVNVSTDEVYGSLSATDPAFTELTPLAPNSPYSASKAGADCLVRAYGETFGLPALTTRCSNNYGPYQFPEKLIPLMITRAVGDQVLPVYGDGRNVRDWLHVVDHADAIWAVCTRGTLGAVYNIGGEAERTNLEVVHALLEAVGKPTSLIQYVTDRPGHDRRYAMDISTIRRELGWAPTYSFERGLAETVAWYQMHERWWTRVQSEAYRSAATLYLGVRAPALAPGATR